MNKNEIDLNEDATQILNDMSSYDKKLTDNLTEG